MKHLICFFLLCLFAPALAAQEIDLQIPADVASFVEPRMRAVALETADLNGDNTADAILVVEEAQSAAESNPDSAAEQKRSTLILTRDKSGKLSLAARNDKAVFCRTCGGVFGDPFAGLTVKLKSFTISHYGGSGWRWTNDFTFNYSRIDRTWQLVRAETSSFHASEPNKAKTKVYLPKQFGKINFADFDPETYLPQRDE